MKTYMSVCRHDTSQEYFAKYLRWRRKVRKNNNNTRIFAGNNSSTYVAFFEAVKEVNQDFGIRRIYGHCINW